jgi:hypothetical protein
MDFFKCTLFPANTAAGSPFRFKVVGRNLQGSITSILTR